MNTRRCLGNSRKILTPFKNIEEFFMYALGDAYDT